MTTTIIRSNDVRASKGSVANLNNNNTNKELINFIKNKLSDLSDLSYNEIKNIIDKLLEQLEVKINEIESIKAHSEWKSNYVVNNITKNYDDLIYTLNVKISNLEKEVEDLKNRQPISLQKSTCCVCLDEIPSHANKECGHLCVCEVCSYHLDDKCPICRTNGKFIKIIK